MQEILVRAFKVWKSCWSLIVSFYSKAACSIVFYLNGVKVKSFSSYGVPYIHISLNAKCSIGSNFKMHNGVKYSDSGLNGICRIEVRDVAILTIGDNVGMSDVTISCHEKITIGNNVLLGVGAQIRDTDNHSLNPQDRLNSIEDWNNKKTAPIIICQNAFIGAYSFILKGVTIGENSIIGAGSIVTKNVPDNEIWAGNPAKFIGKVAVNLFRENVN
ncbi:MAG TPA: acyltransferase [Phnomibacter sp.]|nr:acyltransferase [Phnomibacter sp.]